MKTSAALLLQASLENPLVKHLPPFLTHIQMAEKIANSPCADVDWKPVPVEQRGIFLHQLKATFCASEVSLRIALALQSMLWDGLLSRDPRKPEQQRLMYEVAAYDYKKFMTQSWRHEFVGGAVIRGITGVGKSAAVNRYFSLIPQVIRHEENQEAQWIEFSQLVYLKVPMSADGSRIGFLLNCLRELDRALGTNYFEKYEGKKSSVERLLVDVLHFLALHRCGLLIIEEAQERNLSVSQFSREFLTFFLRLLNHSIPVVIIGNPLAFAVLDTFSQDQSRFSEYGDFTIDPVSDPYDEEWEDEWIGAAWHATLLDEPDEPIENLPQFIWDRTAGFPRILARLRRETMNAAIQLGSSRVCMEHIEIAMETQSMQAARQLVEAFKERDWKALEQFVDIPIAYFRTKWEKAEAAAKKNSDSEETKGEQGKKGVGEQPQEGLQDKQPKAKKAKRSVGKGMKEEKKPDVLYDKDDFRNPDFLAKLQEQDGP